MNFSSLQEAAFDYFWPAAAESTVAPPRPGDYSSSVPHPAASGAGSWSGAFWALFEPPAQSGRGQDGAPASAESGPNTHEVSSSTGSGGSWRFWSWFSAPPENCKDAANKPEAPQASLATAPQSSASEVKWSVWDWFAQEPLPEPPHSISRRPGVSVNDIRAHHQISAHNLGNDRKALSPVSAPMQKEKTSAISFAHVESAAWSIERSQLIGPPGEEAVKLGKARLLDQNTVSSLKDAIEKLNKGIIQCPEGFCVVVPLVFSKRKTKPHYVLYKQDCQQRAFQILGLEDHAKPAEVAPSLNVDQAAATSCYSRGTAAAEAAEKT